MQAMYSFITLASIVVVASLYFIGVLELKDIGISILAMFGTFLGATLAFRLTEAKEKEKIERFQREALNRALFVLIRQHNAVIQLKRDWDKFPSLFEKAFNMPALKPPGYDDLVHRISDLEFLIDSKTPSILFELAIEQERFHQAIGSIHFRNEFHLKEMQVAMASTSMNGHSVTIPEARAILGERIFDGAMNGAKNAYEHISATNESIPKLLTDLRKLAKEIFPNHKFLSFVVPNEQAQKV